ncbi:MAG TPA: glycosyltransferase family 4 protein [Caulobacteraceae bacterium]|nr:glycosyltransferase family 4 protein [Caulobacteraceae bacterium]
MASPPRILAIGPNPPPDHGTSVPFRALNELLRAQGWRVDVLDTHALRRGGPAAFLRLARALLDLARARVLLLSLSRPAVFRAAPLITRTARLLGKKSVIRNFGGDLDVWWEQGDERLRRRIAALLSADLVFLETRNLCRFAAEARPGATVAQLSNFRDPPPPASAAPDPFGAGEALKVAYVGEMTAAKGVPALAEAAKTLGSAVRLIACGVPVDPAQVDALRAAGAAYVGTVPHQGVIDLIRAADVVVCPSQAPQEGYPGVIVEAFLCGTPVVASRWRAIPEIVADGENGLLFEPGDAAGLAAALRRIVDPGLRSRLAAGARRSGEAFLADRWAPAVAEAMERLR